MSNKIYVVYQPYEDKIYYAGSDAEAAGKALARNLQHRDTTQPKCEVWFDGQVQERWGQE